MGHPPLRRAAVWLLLASVALCVVMPFWVEVHHDAAQPGISVVAKAPVRVSQSMGGPPVPQARSRFHTAAPSSSDSPPSVPAPPATNASTNNNNNTPPNDDDAAVCLSPDCIREMARKMARAYPFKNHHPDWIITDESGYKIGPNHTVAGIIYVKNFKAASSTAAGIALRIAHRRAHFHNNSTNPQPTQQTQPTQKPPHAWVKFAHVRGHKYAGRDPARSLLFSSLRDPAARAVSRIFYTSVTQKGQKPTDANLLDKLRWTQRQYGAVSHEGGGYQVRYLSPRKELPVSWEPDQPGQVVDPLAVEEAVREILAAYDFLMVAERMDESVVALMLLAGLDPEDVLVMDAKQNHGADQYLYFSVRDPRSKTNKESCKKSVPAFRSAAVEEHLASDEWRAKNYGDYLLHAAAHASLDRTIADRLGGKAHFRETLEAYRSLKRRAVAACSNETVYHCSPEGAIQRKESANNCYFDDSGCGYPCIDGMLLRAANGTTAKG